VEPITHALTSLALSRAGLNRTTHLATPILVVAGLAPDLDILFSVKPRASLLWSGALTHSLVGASGVALVVALVFWRFGRKQAGGGLRFRTALGLAAIGVAAHLLLDCFGVFGPRLFWPFSARAFAACFVDWIDPWILLFLLAGLLLPALFGLIGEEIGERKKSQGPRRGALVALVLVTLFLGGRGILHQRAVALLLSRDYHGAPPLAAAAFPSAASPLGWRGVVVTPNTLDEIEVPLGPGGYFDPDRSVTRFKPEPSPALDAAQQSETARTFLRYAQLPLASLDRLEGGYRVELRDLRWPFASRSRFNVVAVIELDGNLRVTRQELRFASDD
jgi:inner membrane protein